VDLIVEIRGGAADTPSPDGPDEVFLRVWAVYEAGGLLVSCAWCRRVRIDGTWLVPPHAALAAIDTRNTLSHSICDECAEAARVSTGAPFGAAERRL
jgi:hypothetical protein